MYSLLCSSETISTFKWDECHFVNVLDQLLLYGGSRDKEDGEVVFTITNTIDIRA
jgi:hypothetical protein